MADHREQIAYIDYEISEKGKIDLGRVRRDIWECGKITLPEDICAHFEYVKYEKTGQEIIKVDVFYHPDLDEATESQ